MPIYKIKQTLTEGDDKHTVERLVEAKNEARAVNHVAKDTIESEKAENADIIRLTKDGVNLEQAE